MNRRDRLIHIVAISAAVVVAAVALILLHGENERRYCAEAIVAYCDFTPPTNAVGLVVQGDWSGPATCDADEMCSLFDSDCVRKRSLSLLAKYCGRGEEDNVLRKAIYEGSFLEKIGSPLVVFRLSVRASDCAVATNAVMACFDALREADKGNYRKRISRGLDRLLAVRESMKREKDDCFTRIQEIRSSGKEPSAELVKQFDDVSKRHGEIESCIKQMSDPNGGKTFFRMVGNVKCNDNSMAK